MAFWRTERLRESRRGFQTDRLGWRDLWWLKWTRPIWAITQPHTVSLSLGMLIAPHQCSLFPTSWWYRPSFHSASPLPRFLLEPGARMCWFCGLLALLPWADHFTSLSFRLFDDHALAHLTCNYERWPMLSHCKLERVPQSCATVTSVVLMEQKLLCERQEYN